MEQIDAEAQSELPPRRDPSPRPTTGGALWGHIQNADPTREYRWVSKFDQNALAHYKLSGFTVERYRPDGPMPMSWLGDNHEVNELVEQGDMVLMSVSKERAEEIRQYGHDGEGGQAQADEEEKMLITNRGAMDPMRGIHGFMPGRHFELEAGRVGEHRHGDLSVDDD